MSVFFACRVLYTFLGIASVCYIFFYGILSNIIVIQDAILQTVAGVIELNFSRYNKG